MKVIQLNAWNGKLARQVQQLLDEEQPDVVCLQEVSDMQKRPGSIMAPYHEFAPEEDFPHTHFGPVFSWRFMHEISGFGNAIVAKHPLIETHTVFTKGTFKEDLDNLKHDYNIRNFVHGAVDIDGQLIHVISHHGHHDPTTKNGTEDNTNQNQIIADYASKLDGPVVICGDFNVLPDSPSLKPFARFKNLCVEHAIKTTRNELSKRPTEVIDYVFINDGVHVTLFEASDKLVSNHKALILEFTI